MKAIFIIYFCCILVITAFSQTSKISNVIMDYNNENIIVTYDISSTEKFNKFNILPEFYTSNGSKIQAFSFSGELKSVISGTRKKIYWDFKKDGIALDEKISVKLVGVCSPVIPIGKHLLKSAIFPGWGDYKLSEKKYYAVYGVAFYGCIASSFYFGLSALSNYNNYLNAPVLADANSSYNTAISQRTNSIIFLSTAAVIWAADMFFVTKKARALKNSKVPIPNNYYFQESKPLFAFSEQIYINTKAPKLPPNILIENLVFEDSDQNKCINANEESKIKFLIVNKGKGDAASLTVSVSLAKSIDGLEYINEKSIGNLASDKTVIVEIPIKGTMNLASSEAKFFIKVKEANGFDADPIEMSIPTREFVPPKVEITDYVFTAEGGGQAKLGSPINLKIIVQNTGQGIAKDVAVFFSFPENVFKTNTNNFTIGELKPNENKEINFEFFANKQYSNPTIPISVKLNESWGKFGSNKTMDVKVNQELKKTEIKLVADEQQKTEISIKTLKSDVDLNIPVTTEKKSNCFAVLIGNEDYSSHQTGLSSEANVDFAVNDAQVFKEYLIKTIGIPEKNITLLLNASAGQINQAISKLATLADVSNGDAELIFYYAGHGLPDEKSKDPYIIPVDVSSGNLQYAIKLFDVFNQLSQYPTKRVTVFLDACFSGGARNKELVAERGVKIKVKENVLKGNTIVFASSSGEEASGYYKEKQHGMFTYFLLKKLQESNGNLTLKDLFDYLESNVKKEAVIINNKKQSPKVNVSSDIESTWGTLKFK